MLYFKRLTSGGFAGEGYVNFVFANDAFECMRYWDKTNRRGRRRFARPCNEEMNVEAMNRDGGDHILTTLAGNDSTIFNEGNVDFGKPNYGKQGYGTAPR
jgi:hypothetical protein